MDASKLLIYSIEDISLFSADRELLKFKLDELQSAEFANGQETTYGTGKGGARIAALDKNKTSTVTAANGYVVTGALAAQTGGEIERGDHTVPWEEYLEVNNGEAKITYAAVGDTGSEIPYVYPLYADGSPNEGKAIPIGATANATHFAYDPATKTITLPTNFSGDRVYVKYDAVAKNAIKIENESDKFSDSGLMIARVLAKDPCDDNKIYLGVIEFPKAKVSGNFSVSTGGDTTVHNVEFESLAFGCGGHKKLWDWYIFSEDGLKKTA